jgi:hypothetical protein
VSPELDRIVLKALARDVNDRYQNSADLHADLKAVLEGYRFDVRELRDFMRKEFRREYTKELQDSEASVKSVPADERVAVPAPSTPRRATTDIPVPAASQVPMGAPSSHEDDDDELEMVIEPSEPEKAPPRMATQEGATKKGGFFSRMFKRQK